MFSLWSLELATKGWGSKLVLLAKKRRQIIWGGDHYHENRLQISFRALHSVRRDEWYPCWFFNHGTASVKGGESSVIDQAQEQTDRLRTFVGLGVIAAVVLFFLWFALTGQGDLKVDPSALPEGSIQNPWAEQWPHTLFFILCSTSTLSLLIVVGFAAHKFGVSQEIGSCLATFVGVGSLLIACNYLIIQNLSYNIRSAIALVGICLVLGGVFGGAWLAPLIGRLILTVIAHTLALIAADHSE